MTIDGIAVPVDAPLTVYEAALRAGISIPTLCHRDGVHPTGGCGACTVEDVSTGRLLPACATRASAGMAVQTGSPAAVQARRDALELLLSNHPADCEAPCQMACPAGLPVPLFLEAVSEGRWADAEALARRTPCVCANAAPCEKACRRKSLGGAVAICALHHWLAGGHPPDDAPPRPSAHRRFRSRMIGLTEAALLSFCAEPGDRRTGTEANGMTREAAVYEASRCLQCGCRKPDACRLRDLCTLSGAKQSTFAGGCGTAVRERSGRFRFDSSRCVLCGLCVRTSEQMHASIAPAFHGRGFDARIAPPLGRTWGDVPEPLLAACAAACPTGAMSWEKDAVTL
jgi:ferredoxin